ncbi:MAG: ChbG/HpnK family deacetylase, partial [Dehalococcoidia bacterium]|nr:ChbG/HpnK family deacetylase [Dehalococcoidia bacterium]
MKPPVRWLIINADDLGLSPGVNTGIIEAHRQGVVTSASLMANLPGTAEAAVMARENPELGVGLHLNLTSGQQLTNCPAL